MTKKIIFLALCALLLAPCSAVEAQQTGKIFRIGFLDSSTASGMAGLLDAFRQGLNKLGWIEGKTLSSSIGLLSKKMNGYLSLQRTWFDLRSMSSWLHRRQQRRKQPLPSPS